MRKAMLAAVLVGACAAACATLPAPAAKASGDSAVVVVPKQTPHATEVEGQCTVLENDHDPKDVKIRHSPPSPDWQVAPANSPEFNGLQPGLSLLNSQTRARFMVELGNPDMIDQLFINMRKVIESKGDQVSPIETFSGECTTVQAFVALVRKDVPVGNVIGLVRSKRHPRIGIFFIGFWPHQTHKGSSATANEIANMAAGLRLYR